MATVRIEGLRELQQKLEAFPELYDRELAAIHEAVAIPVARVAADMAPVRSGNLRYTIRATGSKYGGRVVAGGTGFRGGLREPVLYAGPIHWGWPRRNISPNRFLTGALSRRESEVYNEWHRLTDALIDRVFGTQ